MSAPGGDSVTRELVRALVIALEQGLALEAPPSALRNAIDTAQLLGLPALERALATFQSSAGQPGGAELEQRAERLKNLAAECALSGTLEPFRAAADELEAWSQPTVSARSVAEPAGTIPTLALSEVIQDLPLADEASAERARRVRMIAPVAAALRAALDWLEQEGPPPRPLRISPEESVIEVVCANVNAAGLAAAEKVLSSVGGMLMPASVLGVAAPPGAWVVRVPSLAARRSHLMLHQGDLALAVPWHAVVRLYMVPAIEIERGLGRLGHPMLERLRPVSEARAESPVVLIGHGSKLAYLIADRLVWRLEGDAVEAGAPPHRDLGAAVRTEEGELYWTLDPARALAAVPAPEIAPADRPTDAETEPLPVLRDDEVEPLDRAPQAPGGTPPQEGAPPAAPALAVAYPAFESDEDARFAEAPQVSAQRRALVAEDSLAARLFLTRLLEREGFSVRAVSTSTELFDELVDEGWTLVCVDVELPNSREADVLERVVERLAGGTAPLVALIRDAADLAMARAAGVQHSLRKPFEPGGLKTLLERLGMTSEAS